MPIQRFMSHNTPSLTVAFKQIRVQIFTPLLTPILTNPTTGWAIMGAAAAHLCLVSANLPSWQCPFLHVLGIPCPGCGLSRAISALIRNDWQTSIQYHALASFFLIGLVFISIITIMPHKQRQKALTYLAWLEKKTGFVTVYLIALVVYWLARLTILGDSFINLMLG